MKDVGAANLAQAMALVDGLCAAGLRTAVVCPGSRSTPMAVALASDPRVRVLMHVDERSAAYFALGIALRDGQPVALLCSSGTAAANFLPAVAEAHLSRVPLVVLTADRPAELRDWGAAQTIDQRDIYGSNVRWFHELATPGESDRDPEYAYACGRRAATIALSVPMGPVHLNLPYREPLMSSDMPLARPTPHPLGSSVVQRASIQPDGDQIAQIAEHLSGIERGIIVCGPTHDAEVGDAACALGRALGYPVLADILSNVRECASADGVVIDAYDAMLRDPAYADSVTPDVVIRIGAIATSKPLNLFLQRSCAAQVVIDVHRALRDPSWQATTVIAADPALALTALHAAVTPRQGGAWLSSWLAANTATRQVFREQFASAAVLNELLVSWELGQHAPPGATIMVGSSMPVRDADTFCVAGPRGRRWVANRGANGIDGVVSTALGVSLDATGPCYLLIGDLSFYHDMNGLLAARLHGLALTIIVVNNNGGGIFSFLPQATQVPAELFESLYGTPIDLDVQAVANLWGATYHRATSPEDLRAAIIRGDAPGLKIVEVCTDRAANVFAHREMWKEVAAALQGDAR